ncbi:hypothetical protein N7517_003436 [Penicillium concentricum]|uniref:BZIP domain-containing protein n=1 Tax=Penicillium concentricum TaxID=293559 RepID=A0A9W9VLW5_9EURO|nr:uncharacterized protein N7517_003436 [Penicillium concentricum]KAJ5385525.1 hypothetical protein N7517_003436 [Penicillium concentricum]
MRNISLSDSTLSAEDLLPSTYLLQGHSLQTSDFGEGPSGHNIISPGTRNSDPERNHNPSGPYEQLGQTQGQNLLRSSQSAKGSSRKKRGRPRKDDNDQTEELPADRRRAQIRLAQRAYRTRQEGALLKYEARITQLETGMKKMNAAISSFGQNLGETGILATHPDLHAHIRNILETCNNVSEEAGLTTAQDQVPYSTAEGGSTSSCVPQKQGQEHLSSSLAPLYSPHRSPVITLLNPSPWSTIGDPPMPLGPASPLLFDIPTTSVVELSQFIRQLRLACAYHAYISLRNSSVRLEDLRRKFRFLLSILTREELTSYFEASVQARIYPERMTKWQALPFFAVGGAGTHYISSSPSVSNSHNASQGDYNQPSIRENPLTEFSPEVQEQMDGKWFDIRDLEGFLQERGVHFIGRAPGSSTEARRGVSMQAASPVHLIKSKTIAALNQLPELISSPIGLVDMCICLGRSPGWRPLDVEKALRMSLWA